MGELAFEGHSHNWRVSGLEKLGGVDLGSGISEKGMWVTMNTMSVEPFISG